MGVDGELVVDGELLAVLRVRAGVPADDHVLVMGRTRPDPGPQGDEQARDQHPGRDRADPDRDADTRIPTAMATRTTGRATAGRQMCARARRRTERADEDGRDGGGHGDADEQAAGPQLAAQQGAPVAGVLLARGGTGRSAGHVRDGISPAYPGAVSATSDTPPVLLGRLASLDPTRPRLTWYDDAPGPTQGERIELSGRVLATWSAKAAGLLQEEFDAGPGSVIRIDLPVHWRAAYWLFAAWSVGAHAVVGEASAAPDADVVITDRPVEAVSEGAASVVAVSLPALARGWSGAALPAGVLDEAAELPSHSDVFVPVGAPPSIDAALTTSGGTWSYADLVPAARAESGTRGWADRPRVLTSSGPSDAVACWLAPWAADGSVVLVRAGPAARDDATWAKRAADERVTDECG